MGFRGSGRDIFSIAMHSIFFFLKKKKQKNKKLNLPQMLRSFFLRPLPKVLALRRWRQEEKKKKNYLCLYKYICIKTQNRKNFRGSQRRRPPGSAPSARGLLRGGQDALTCLEPLVMHNAQNCEKGRKNMQSAAEGGEPAPPRRERERGPRAPPRPSRAAAAAPRRRPRSARPSAAGRPCARPARVTSVPPRAPSGVRGRGRGSSRCRPPPHGLRPEAPPPPRV